MRRLLVWLVTLSMAALCGYLGSRMVRPFSYLGVGVWTAGGAAAGILVTMIPGQAWRVLRRGRIYLSLLRQRRTIRRLVKAERAALSRLAQELPSAQLLGDLAVAELLRQEFETAEATLARGLELSPADPRLLNNLGVALAAQEQYERAAELFVQALSAGTDHEAAINLALIVPHVQDPERLVRMIEQSGRTLTGRAMNNVGATHAARGEWALAEKWFTSAVQEDPDLPAARANLGLVAYRDGRLQDAADEIMQASRQAPNEPAFTNHLGVILAAAGQTDQAAQYLRRAHRLDPASVAIRANMAAVDADSGHWHVARKELRALLNVDERSADVYYNLAVCELAVQEAGAAADAAAAAIAAGDTGSDAYTVLAVALWEQGRRAEALSHFESAVKAPDAGPIATGNLGRALLLENRVEQAEAALAQGLERWPADPHLVFDAASARLAAAAMHFDANLPLSQRQPLIAAVQRSFNDLQSGLSRPDLAAEAHVNLGLYHYMQEGYDSAAEHFEAAAKLVQKSREISFLIGTTFGKEGARQTQRTEDGDTAPTAVGRGYLRRAVPFLEAAMESREVLVPASHNLGRCLYVLKEFERALAAFRKSIRLANTPELNTMAALSAARQAQRIQLLFKTQLLSEGKREQLRARSLELLNVAVHYFRQALLHNELDPTVHGNLGIAYMLRNRENDVEAALRHWERMRAIGGGAMERRYAELAQMENLADPSRVGFDDRNVKLRDIEPLRWLAVPPPRPTSIRFVTEPVPVQRPWRLAATTEPLQAALELRDAAAASVIRLQRLRV